MNETTGQTARDREGLNIRNDRVVEDGFDSLYLSGWLGRLRWELEMFSIGLAVPGKEKLDYFQSSGSLREHSEDYVPRLSPKAKTDTKTRDTGNTY